MDQVAIKRLASENSLPTIDEVDASNVTLLPSGHLSISGRCAIKIESTSSILDRSVDIAILDDAGSAFATLCFTRGQDVENPADLTLWQYVAYLTEITEQEFLQENIWRYSYDYAVVDEDRLDEYLKDYADGSPIWGGYSHKVVRLSSWTRETGAIHAKSGLQVPTPHHNEAFERYINANNSLDRFLRLYHSVELLFDYVTFRKVQAVGDDLKGYAVIMKENGKDEFDRLVAIISEYCSSSDRLAGMMNAARKHENVCRAIFQEYTKESNPLKSDKFEKVWELVVGEALSSTNLVSNNIVPRNDVHKFICKIAAYWIYRIRCSIAHNRVGEFILTDSDDDFVANLGIPLLQCAVEQILSNSDFQALNRS